MKPGKTAMRRRRKHSAALDRHCDAGPLADIR